MSVDLGLFQELVAFGFGKKSGGIMAMGTWREGANTAQNPCRYYILDEGRAHPAFVYQRTTHITKITEHRRYNSLRNVWTDPEGMWYGGVLMSFENYWALSGREPVDFVPPDPPPETDTLEVQKHRIYQPGFVSSTDAVSSTVANMRAPYTTGEYEYGEIPNIYYAAYHPPAYQISWYVYHTYTGYYPDESYHEYAMINLENIVPGGTNQQVFTQPINPGHRPPISLGPAVFDRAVTYREMFGLGSYYPDADSYDGLQPPIVAWRVWDVYRSKVKLLVHTRKVGDIDGWRMYSFDPISTPRVVAGFFVKMGGGEPVPYYPDLEEVGIPMSTYDTWNATQLAAGKDWDAKWAARYYIYPYEGEFKVQTNPMVDVFTAEHGYLSGKLPAARTYERVAAYFPVDWTAKKAWDLTLDGAEGGPAYIALRKASEYPVDTVTWHDAVIAGQNAKCVLSVSKKWFIISFQDWWCEIVDGKLMWRASSPFPDLTARHPTAFIGTQEAKLSLTGPLTLGQQYSTLYDP